MAIASAEPLAKDLSVPRAAPRPSLLWAIALSGCGAATFSFVAAFHSEAVTGDLGEPLLVAILVNWITVSYVVCGVIAWSRR